MPPIFAILANGSVPTIVGNSKRNVANADLASSSSVYTDVASVCTPMLDFCMFWIWFGMCLSSLYLFFLTNLSLLSALRRPA